MKPTKEASKAMQDLIVEYEGDIAELQSDYDGSGICLNCGGITDQVEPDAENYFCLNCDCKAVMGIEQALLAHFI